MNKFILVAAFALASLFAPSASADVLPTYEDWAVRRLSAWAPPGKSMFVDAKETEEAGTARYREIVRAAASVAFDPSEPPLVSGPYGRSKTLAIMLAIASSESAFRLDVDLGLGTYAKGDGGGSWCLMQVRLGKAVMGKSPMRIVVKGDLYEYAYDGKTGWGGEDLVKDRAACFRAGLHVMRASFIACSYLPLEERLAAYASGTCDRGRSASRVRVGKAVKWLAEEAPPAADDAVLAALSVLKAVSSAVPD